MTRPTPLRVLTWPQVAIGCKRFHDFGKSGGYQLVGLIPSIGGLIVLLWAPAGCYSETAAPRR